MSTLQLRFGPFMASHASLNARYIGNPNAESSHNARHEDGSLQVRNGYRRYTDAPTWKGNACQTVTLLHYVTGVKDGNFYEEYITARRHGAAYSGFKLFRFDADPATSGFPNDKVIGKPNAVDRISFDSATGGTCKLRFDGQTTASTIAFNASASTIQTALESLSNIDPGDVTVTLVSGVTHTYDVVYDGQYRGTTVGALSIQNDLLTGGGGSHTVTRTTAASDYKMDEGYWDCFLWDGQAHIYNPDAGNNVGADDEPMLRYTVGDYDSLTAIVPPATPKYTNSPMSIVYGKSPTGGTSYQEIRWTGADPLNPATDVAYTSPAAYDPGAAGGADISSLKGESFEVCHVASTLGRAKVKADMSVITAGTQNLTYNDPYFFELVIPNVKFQISPDSVKLYFETTSGTEQLLAVTVEKVTDSSGLVTRILCYAKFGSRTRTDWSSVKYISFEYDVTLSSATASENMLRISPVKKGGVVDWGAVSDKFEAFHGVFQIGYGYGVSSTGLKSGVAGPLVCAKEDLLGQEILKGFYLGTIPYLTIPASSASDVDQIIIYERRRKTSGDSQVVMSEWRTVETIADPGTATTNYTFASTEKDFNDASPYTGGDFQYDEIIKAKVIHGCVLYGYRNQRQNLRWSAVGLPYTQASLDGSNVDIDDPNRGANFSMSDDQEDVPVDFWPVGQVTVILGEKGAHYQVGTKPALMTFPRRVNGAPGCAGRHASCPWLDESGNPGVAYIGRDGQSVWFIYVTGVSDLESMVGIRELTYEERTSAYDYVLRRNPNLNRNVIALNPDLRQSALWYNYSYQAMVGRRPSLLDGKRFWEHYTYGNQSNGNWTGEDWTLYSFDQDRGIKATTPDGIVDELEYDSSNSMATIGGVAATPDSTDTTANTVFFYEDPRWSAGLQFSSYIASDGLGIGINYFCRPVTTVLGTYAFYTTRADAIADTSRINITGNVAQRLTPVQRDNGNALATNSIWWKGPILQLPQDVAIVRVDAVRARMEDTPGIKVWADRNPETSFRTVPANKLGVRQWPTTQGRQIQITVSIADNSAPVFFVDQYVTPKGNRPNW